MPSLRELIINRYGRNKSEKDILNDDYQDLSDYVYPKGTVFEPTNASKDKETEKTKRAKVVDKTAERAVEDLASFIVSTLAPAGSHWLMLLPEDPTLLKDAREMKALDLAARRIEKYLFKPEVKFHLAFDESALDVCGMGTGIPLMQTIGFGKDSDLNFRSVPFEECFFEENNIGEIDVVFRLRSVTAKQILEDYVYIPEEERSHDLDEVAVKSLEETARIEPTKKFELIHCVVPRGDSIYSAAGTSDRDFASIHLFREGGISKGGAGGILRNSSLDFFPYRVYRFRKRSGRVYGYGPGNRALADTIALQRMKKSNINVAQLSGRPPMHIPFQSYAKRLNISPGAANHAKRGGTNKDNKAEPLLVVGNLPVGVDRELMTKNDIRESFYLDQIQERKDARMSATESTIRKTERLQTMQPQLTRIVVEFLNPTIEYVYEFLVKKGILDKPSDKLKKSGISPVYISQLLQSQADTDILALERLAAVLANISGAFPKTINAIDALKIPKFLVERLFLPHDFLKDEEEAQEREAEEQEITTATNQAEAAEKASKAALNTAKAAETLGISI